MVLILKQENRIKMEAKKCKWYCNIDLTSDEIAKISAGHMASYLMNLSRMFETEEQAKEYFDYMRKEINEASRKWDERK